MKNSCSRLFFDRLLSAFLIVSLCLQGPAFALRPEQSPKVKAGLEEVLRPASSLTLIEEAVESQFWVSPNMAGPDLERIALRSIREMAEKMARMRIFQAPSPLEVDTYRDEEVVEDHQELDIRDRGAERGTLDHSILLAHVIHNAVDAIAARAKYFDHPQIGHIQFRVRRPQKYPYVILELSDNGIGIDGVTLEKLFAKRVSTKDKEPEEWIGGSGQAIERGFYGNLFLREWGGKMMLETRRLSDPPEMLRYTPATPIWRSRTDIRAGRKAEMGTTVRWIFPAARFSAGAEERTQEDRLLEILAGEIDESSPALSAFAQAHPPGLPRKLLQQLRQMEFPSLKAIEREIRKERALKGISFERGELGNVLEAVRRFQVSRDPLSPKFDIEEWAKEAFAESPDQASPDSSQMTGQDLLAWADLFLKSVRPDFQFTFSLDLAAAVGKQQMKDLLLDVNHQIMLPHGRMIYSSAYTHQPLFPKASQMGEWVTPAGRKVPISLLKTPLIAGLPGAVAEEKNIFVFEALEQKQWKGKHSQLQASWQEFRRRLEQGKRPDGQFQLGIQLPAPEDSQGVRSFLSEWVAQWAFGRYPEEEALRHYRGFALTEEGAHSDQFAYARALLGRNLWTRTNPDDGIRVVSGMLKDRGFLRDALEAVRNKTDPEKTLMVESIMEIEAWLVSLRDSPEPPYRFLSILYPSPGDAPEHTRGRELLLPVLMEALFPGIPEGRDRNRALMYAALEYSNFNTRLKNIAQTLLDQEFIPVRRRETPVPWLPAAKRITLHLGFHALPGDLEPMVEALRLGRAGVKRFYVGEQGPWGMELLENLRPDLARLLPNILWDHNFDRSFVAGQLKKLLEVESAAPSWKLQQLRANPALFNDPQMQKDLGAYLPLYRQLAEHPEITPYFEKTPWESAVSVLREADTYRKAVSVLIGDRDREGYFRMVADHYRWVQTSYEQREAAIEKGILRPVFAALRADPQAELVLQFGGNHTGLKQRILRLLQEYGMDPSDVSIAQEELMPLQRAMEPYRETLLADPDGTLPADPAVRREALLYLPWNLLIAVQLESRRAPNSQQLVKAAETVTAALSDTELNALIATLQERHAGFYRTAQGTFQGWAHLVKLYVIAWLNEHGKLGPALDNLDEELKQVTTARVDQAIGRPPTAGAEEGAKLLLRREFPQASARRASEIYERFRKGALLPLLERNLNLEAQKLFFDPASARREIAVLETLVNLMEHGQGGLMEIYRLRNASRPSLMFRFSDRSPDGMNDPNVLLQKSLEAHAGIWRGESPSERRNYGFANIARLADTVTLESAGKKWVLVRENPGELRFEPAGVSAAVRGSVFTLIFENMSPPPAPGAEENDYELLQTDPRNHDDRSFTYFVHMTSGLDAALISASGIHPDLLTEPHRVHLISASILHRDPQNQVLSTYRNQQVGYILRVPQENMVWVAPFDFISDRGEQYLEAILRERDQKGLLPFSDLVEASQKYGIANEALVMGTGPGGRKVETVGVVLVQNPFQGREEEAGNNRILSRAQKLNLPVVSIHPENRPARPILHPDPEEFVRQLNLPPHPTPAQLAEAQAQFDAWQRNAERAYWEERMKYFPSVLREDPPAAGAEEDLYREIKERLLSRQLPWQILDVLETMSNAEWKELVTYPDASVKALKKTDRLTGGNPSKLLRAVRAALKEVHEEAQPEQSSTRMGQARLQQRAVPQAAPVRKTAPPPVPMPSAFFSVDVGMKTSVPGTEGTGTAAGAEEGYREKAFKAMVEKTIPRLSRIVTDPAVWARLRREGDRPENVAVILRPFLTKQSGWESWVAGFLRMIGRDIEGRFQKISGQIAEDVAWFQEHLDPEAAPFSLKKWAETLYYPELITAVPFGTADEFVNRIVRPVEPGFQFRLPRTVRGRSTQERESFLLLEGLSQVNEEVLIPRGLVALPGATGEPVVHAISEKLAEIVTRSGRTVPVYLVQTREGGFPSTAAAAARYIVVSDSAINTFKQEHAAFRNLWNEIASGIKAGTMKLGIPQDAQGLARFIYQWVGAWAYGRYSLEEAFRRYLSQTVFPEEAAHSDADAFGESRIGHGLTVYRAGERMELAKLLLRGAETGQTTVRSDQEARAVLELEAKTAALWSSDEPAFHFVHIVAPELFFSHHPTTVAHYRELQEQMRRILFPQAVSERDWRAEVVKALLDLDSTDAGRMSEESYRKFNRRLKEVGRELYRQKFLTLKERRDRHPQPWGEPWISPAAGAEEEVRFKPAEQPGIIGFLLEGQGLPFGTLFALAAAEGHPVYFAGVATQAQLDALTAHLPAEAAELLRERIVASDGIGIERARDLAEGLLIRQVPLDDREILQISVIDYVMQDLLKQVLDLLRMTGLELVAPVDQVNAMVLLEAA